MCVACVVCMRVLRVRDLGVANLRSITLKTNRTMSRQHRAAMRKRQNLHEHAAPPGVQPPPHLPQPDPDAPNFDLLAFLTDEFIDSLSKQQLLKWHHDKAPKFRKNASLKQRRDFLKALRDTLQRVLQGTVANVGGRGRKSRVEDGVEKKRERQSEREG